LVRDCVQNNTVSIARKSGKMVFPLKAADFIKRGVAKGPALGAALRAAEAAWIAADFPADGEALAGIVTAAVANA
jgi:poly(A) polymerase